MPNGSCELQFFDVVAATNLELFSIRVVKWRTVRTTRPQDICVACHLAFPRLNRQSAVQSSLRNGMHYAYTRKAILWNYLRDSVLQKDVWRRRWALGGAAVFVDRQTLECAKPC